MSKKKSSARRPRQNDDCTKPPLPSHSNSSDSAGDILLDILTLAGIGAIQAAVMIIIPLWCLVRFLCYDAWVDNTRNHQ